MVDAAGNDSEINKSLPIRSFGVGCFHFQLKDKVDTENDLPARYITILKDFISHLPNVESFDTEKILFLHLAQNFSAIDNDGGIHSAYGVYPWPGAWDFSFRISIPKNIQKELVFYEDLESEKFLVRIQYDDDMPVVMIEGLDQVLSKPSGAVVVIRKYFASSAAGAIHR